MAVSHKETCRLVFLAFRRNAQPSRRGNLRGLGICHQQAFREFHGNGKSSKIRNLTQACIACQ